MEEDVEDEKEVETLTDAPKEQREQKQALDKVNADVTEEKELDTTKAQKNLQSLFQGEKKREELRALKEKELAAVQISEENIQLIMKELELPRNKAERALREKKGDVVATIRYLISPARS